MRQYQSTGQNSQAARLVCRCQGDRDHVNQRRDAQGSLQRDEVHEASGALLGRLGECGSYTASASVGEEGENGAEGGDGEDTMVHLDGAGVLEHVAPPQVGAVLLAGVELVPELGPGRRQAEAHLGEFVVDEAGVEAGDEAARHDGEEDQAAEGEGGSSKGGDGRVLEGLDGVERGLRVGDETVGAEDGEGGKKHPGIADEGRAEVSRQTILRDARMGTRGEEIILQA